TKASGVFKWDGRNWQKISSASGAGVFALANWQGDIILGGDFNLDTKNVPAKNIAGWNGDVFFNLGEGTNGPVYALAVGTENLYAGGKYTKAGYASAHNIASWNSKEWVALTDAHGSINGDSVRALQYLPKIENSSCYLKGEQLFVGGQDITLAGNFAVSNVAFWDEKAKTWSSLTGDYAAVSYIGVNGKVNALAVDASGDCNIYIGGSFSDFVTSTSNLAAADTTVNNVATWLASGSGNTWDPLFDSNGTSQGVTGGNGVVDSLRWDSVNEFLLLGGNFSTAGNNLPVANMARWQPTPQWFELQNTGSGTNNTVYAFAQIGPEFYFGGAFDTVFYNNGASYKANISSWTLNHGFNPDEAFATPDDATVRSLIIMPRLLILD
ncbi:MAG: hypothetical protein ACHP9Y_05470, partial [Gammaproteobacteria bacterium]